MLTRWRCLPSQVVVPMLLLTRNMLAASFVAPFTDPCGLGQPFLRVRTVSPPAPAALRRMLSAPPCHSRSFSEKKRSRIGLFMSTAANLHTGPDTSQPFVSQIRHVQLGTAGILSQRLSDLGVEPLPCGPDFMSAFIDQLESAGKLRHLPARECDVLC